MIAELNAGFSAAKHAYTVVKGISDLKNQTEINSAIFDVQQNLLSVQQQLSEAQQRFDELAAQKKNLEIELANRDAWEKTASRYKLTEIAENLFIYALIDSQDEPAHWLCPNCFQNRKKSILQKKNVSQRNHTCPNCGFDIIPKPIDYAAITRNPRRRTGLY
jgi:hypothetical protein